MKNRQNEILSANDLSVGYRNGKRESVILSGLNLSLRQGELVCLLGANGIGKSTLLRTLSGVQPPISGTIAIAGKEISNYTQQQLSKLISIVYTDRTLAGALTVTELVSLGRHPYTGFFGRLGSEDKDMVAHAIETVGMSHKASSYIATLSDGERQKAMIARALAQETPIIILDEPTAFLDVASRIETMNSLHRLASEEHKAILLSSHDISQPLALAHRLWLLRNDRTMIEGQTESLVLSGELHNLFANRQVSFDPEIGDFIADRNFSRQVKLVCQDPLLRRWIINALKRNDIGLSDNSPDTITALSPTSIKHGSTEYNSIETLLSAITSADTEIGVV